MPFIHDSGDLRRTLKIDEYGRANTLINFNSGTDTDSFGRLRVSSSNTLFDSQQEYGLDTTKVWSVAANDTLPSIRSINGSVTAGSSSVGPRNVDTRMVPITCGSTNGNNAILQSRMYCRYIPGYSHLIFITGIFTTNATYTTKVVLRTSTSGTPSDSVFASQSDWNIDKMDGTGVSGITLDLTKTQILVISAQWLGVGRVIIGFDIDGCLYPVHEFLNANTTLTVPYTQSFNLPVRLETRTSGSNTIARVGYFDSANGVFLETTNNTAGGTIQFCCCSVQSEGAVEQRGFPYSQASPTSSITVTTRRPIISIRPSALFQGITNRSHIELSAYWITAATNPSIYEIVAGGILSGANWKGVGYEETTGAFVPGIRYKITVVGNTDFRLIGASSNTVGVSFVATGVGGGTTGKAVPEYSCVEYDTSATTISSGIVLWSGEAIAGTGASRNITTDSINLRTPLVISQIDSLTAYQLPVSLVCTSTTGNSLIRGGFNWYEQTN